jgi:hydrogenase maturation protein HypF
VQRLLVQGRIQGVGFRPLVYRLASELGLKGRVRNTLAGVRIELQGEASVLQQFSARLEDQLPVIARIDQIDCEHVADEPGLNSFSICPSEIESSAISDILPDLAPCHHCLAELFDPTNRRWRHPFINCTHCGPRFSILRQLPYDRGNTSMSRFTPCLSCRQEYDSPEDRRFHAQPNACHDCGPSVWLETAAGERLPNGDPLQQAVDCIGRGEILALKGIGGFHLVCDARNPMALARLRERKQRPHKPFAVMAANRASLAPLVQLDDGAEHWLAHPGAPVVILPKTRQALLPEAIAPGLDALGVMLPQSPLHWLLFHQAAGCPAGTHWLNEPHPMLLVMTSANLSGEPLVHTNENARKQLSGVADLFLLHDRDIIQPQDDPVVSLLAQPHAWVRSGRGFSPQRFQLGQPGPSVLALGGYLKNTMCISQQQYAWVSAPTGDLASVESCRRLQHQTERLPAMLGVVPERVSVDLQPDSFGYQWAGQCAEQLGTVSVPVQHHHAHVAAVMAEHRLTGPVLGLALDGFGLGESGELKGGELLKLTASGYEPLGGLLPMPLPGGDRAAREPWRLALALLWQMGREDLIEQRVGQHDGWSSVLQMLHHGFNCPLSSSLGRVFDAVAGLLGVCDLQTYEAQAAMLLEARVRRLPGATSGLWHITPDNQLDLSPLLEHLLQVDNAQAGAECFHANLSAALADWVICAAREHSIEDIVLSGGCLLNRWLRARLVADLKGHGVRVFLPQALPPGDGALALGQAWVAIMRANIKPEEDSTDVSGSTG